MQLDAVTAEIRPRSDWEAADLGLALTRKHLAVLMKLWFIFVVPVMLVIAASLWSVYPLAALFAIWWLKPVFDRVPIFYLSRVLFGEKPSVGTVAKAYPRMWFRRFFWRMLLARFSPYRSFVMPVEELEGLRGNKFSKRASLLGRYGASVSVSVMTACSVLEQICMLALYFLFTMLLPEALKFNFEAVFAEIAALQESGLPIEMSQALLVLYILTITLIEPFYVGAGFGLYINSRTITEGWDIELAFKRLNERLDQGRSSGQKIAILAICCMVAFGTSLKAQDHNSVAPESEQLAESELFDTEEELANVYQSKDFKVYELTVNIAKPKPSKQNWGNIPFIGELIIGLLWFAGIAALVFIIYQIVKNFPSARVISRPGIGFEKPKVTTVMGMEVTQESLPSDILAVAKSAWSEGDSRRALSLLYRGAIVSLVEYDQIPIEEGDTEADCLRRVQQKGDLESRDQYFEELTHSWLRQAYAHERPMDSVWERLCSSWPFHLSAREKGGQQ